MLYFFSVLALAITALDAQRLVEVRRDDGSYSVGINSNSQGGTGDSVAALLTKSSGWTGRSPRSDVNAGVNIELPNLLATGLQITKQVPYLEILRLVESFLRLKGEIAGQVWNLFYDNAHIWVAVRDTLISKISTLHVFTLNAVIILRKVLEFASTLFSNVNVNVGASGPLFNAGVNFG